MNIAVIGAGNIGRRHLQALSKLEGDYKIYSIDPSLDALQSALDMYNEVKTGSSPDLYRYENIAELPQKLFGVIIATNSKQRYSVTKLLIDKEVKYIIFEKVLFQNNDAYSEIADVLRFKQIKAWVNCWRRSVPLYQKLKQKNQYEDLLSFDVIGSNWGMTSNSIHFIDLLDYFSGSTEYQFTNNNVSVMKSKRNGYYEFVGTLKGLFGQKKIPFSFASSVLDNSTSFEIKLNYVKTTITINDDEEWWMEKSSEKSSEKQTFDVPFQSNMTQNHINNLVEKGDCDLTPFEISSSLHSTMIDYFTKIFKQNNIVGCPIT